MNGMLKLMTVLYADVCTLTDALLDDVAVIITHHIPSFSPPLPLITNVIFPLPPLSNLSA